MLNRKLLIVYSAIVIDPLIVQSYHPLVSVLKTAFNVNIELIALSLTFHMMPLAILSLFSGTLSDLYYRPKILMYGLFISSIGSLLAFVSPNIYLFLLSRIIQGIGSALVMPIAYALVADITPSETIGKAMSLTGIFAGFFGVTLGPLISGFLARIEWRLVPLLTFTYSLMIGILSRIILKGLVKSQKTGSVRQIFQRLRKIAKNRNIALLSFVGFVTTFTFNGIQPLISDMLALPPLLLEKAETGIIFSTVGLVGIFFSFIGGHIVDRVGARKTMIFGFLMMVSPMVLLIFANSYWMYLILLSALGGFINFTYLSRSVLVVELMPEARGTASSLSTFAVFLGFASAPVVLTQIYVALGINSVYLSNMFLLLLCVIFAALIRTESSK